MNTKLFLIFFLQLTCTVNGQSIISGRILSNNNTPLFRSIIMIEFSDRLPLILEDEQEFTVKTPILKQA